MPQKIREKNPKTGSPWGAKTGIPSAIKSMPKHYFMGKTSESHQGREPGPQSNNEQQDDSGKPKEPDQQ